ncbi:hypothetical protein [Sphingopyxis sp.]|mgnify:CR=1 FL=1|jgi:hypothetical protein|uniref:hypothetical protein n=1 Tax=Sphingopyxis sp. TaxID=1908224 RepID=UPI0025F293A0|nr:hypothetical protein [Sphingopyxis sp.]MBK6412639.1 hypothetical protein [Sphingopyxis sp.]
MDFLKLIQSLDELLYEIMSWLVFYPVTLWRALTKPLKMMDYSEAELGDPAEQQYSDTLSPPLFLLLTVALTHAVELSLVGQDQLVTDRTGLSVFISDDSSLILIRVAFFSIFPLIMAARMVRARHVKLDRGPLKPPFYSQCYVTAPFAMIISAASILMRMGRIEWEVAGLALLVFALLWFGTLQILWFAHHLRTGYWRAAGHASRAMVEALVLFTVVSQIFR